MDFYRELPPLTDLVRLGDLMIAERRLAPREPFTDVQYIRPVLRDGVQRRGRFVRCHDLTTAGVSFWSPEAFVTDRLILTIERQGTPFELLLDVSHQTQVTCLHEPLYLIGGRFIIDSAN